jgi:hypothetical protein
MTSRRFDTSSDFHDGRSSPADRRFLSDGALAQVIKFDTPFRLLGRVGGPKIIGLMSDESELTQEYWRAESTRRAA